DDQRRFELVEIIAPDAQRIDDHALLRKELDVIQPAEGGGVLILASAGEAEIDSFNLERQTGHLVGAKWKLKRASERLDKGDDQRGRGPETRSGGNVDRRRDHQRKWAPAAIALHDVRIDRAVQHQPLPDGQVGVRMKQLLLINIPGAKNELARVV